MQHPYIHSARNIELFTRMANTITIPFLHSIEGPSRDRGKAMVLACQRNMKPSQQLLSNHIPVGSLGHGGCKRGLPILRRIRQIFLRSTTSYSPKSYPYKPDSFGLKSLPATFAAAVPLTIAYPVEYVHNQAPHQSPSKRECCRSFVPCHS
jgi:hypothetical protein